MDYRLLREGEVIKEGDDYYWDHKWTRSLGMGSIIGQPGNQIPYRRPIPSPWIAMTERHPTKADATPDGYVIWRDPRYGMNVGRYDSSMGYAFWMPIPPLPNDLQQTTTAPETPIPQASSPVKERSIPKDNWMLDLLALYKTPENVCAWLSAPHRLLNYQKPIDAVLDLPNGWVKVAKIVDQLASGAYL